MRDVWNPETRQHQSEISGIPHESPRPQFLMAEHPGLIEFSYRNSSNKWIEIFRREVRERELMLFLCAILGPPVTSHSKYAKHEWVYVMTDGNLTSEYLQIGYSPGDLWKTKDDSGFAVNDTWQTVEKISSQTYYAKHGAALKRSFVVPDNFEESYERFSSLPKDDRGRFLRSAHWYKTSSEVYYASRSLAYAVLVFAMEALMPHNSPRNSSNKWIEIFRREVRERELMLFLCAILGPPVTSHSKYAKHEWVYVMTDGNLTSEYLQIGYSPGDLWKTKDDSGFAVNDTWQTVEKISSQTYYAKHGAALKRSFVVPDNFEESYERFSSLPKDDRGRFLRSAHWYKTSSEVYYASRSLAYAVLVFAMEALMPHAQEGDKCETCGIPKRDSISQRFQAFHTSRRGHNS